jgi:hypothetical protein
MKALLKSKVLFLVFLISIFHFGCKSKYASIEGTIIDIATLKPLGHITIIAQTQTDIKEERAFAYHKVHTNDNGQLVIRQLLSNKYYKIQSGTADLFLCEPAEFSAPEANQTKLIDTLFALKPTVSDINKTIRMIKVEISSSDNSDNTSYVARFVKAKLQKENCDNFVIFKEANCRLCIFAENYKKDDFSIEINNDITTVKQVRTIMIQECLSTSINNSPINAIFYEFRCEPAGIDKLYRKTGEQMVHNGARRIVAIKTQRGFGIYSNSAIDENDFIKIRKLGELQGISRFTLL